MNRLRRLDIQTKIILVLVAVIVPTFLLVTTLENQLAKPMLKGEMKQLGLTAAESLATKIEGSHWLQRPDGVRFIEDEIQEMLYLQTSVVRMEVYGREGNGIKLLASSVIDDAPVEMTALVDRPATNFREDAQGDGQWDITVPIRREGVSSKTKGKVIGMVRLVVSTRTVDRLLETFSRITALAAIVSVVILILVLSFFLRKAVSNERLLRQAENQNLQLSEQLHETQRQLMNVEKLAVMGQLTANFAHEIGTPLNAVGGHLQLLDEELEPQKASLPRSKERLETIRGQLQRIEKIVQNFLQTTSKPVSQTQLVDLNKIVDKTMGIVGPRVDSLGLDVRCQLDRKMGPVRAVPLDIEQILLNVVNNSLDSLQSKRDREERRSLRLEVRTKTKRRAGEDWAEITIHDTGMGIAKANLRNVVKPFFTTKRPGEGTGLGLTICHQLASKYGGVLSINSKEGAWANVTLQLPYRNGVQA